MTHAYNELYLSKAQITFGSMLDFAFYDLKMPLSVFYDKFLNSEVSTLFAKGNPSVIAGKSGVELALEVINDESKSSAYNPVFIRRPEYWTGWVLAYFQWYSNLSFSAINDKISIDKICSMYNPYHEMDVSQFCDYMIKYFDLEK